MPWSQAFPVESFKRSVNRHKTVTSPLRKDGKLPDTVQHRQVKYLNNVIEADHGKLRQLIRPVRGFKTLRTAYATIKGFEVMRALKKGQAKFFQLQEGIMGEVRLIERQFGIYTS
ncbi:DDE-type integrase/transposase/recombinase [Acetobacter thailandicus]|uniref:DDE-type integrase/transposase/recombinase n=1 Tax=Acetobacter thailandicus TaxID=1502842 RepID=UPI0031FE7C49